MSGRRKDALDRIEELLPRLLEHLELIQNMPASTTTEHWRIEAKNWLKQMEAQLRHVGKKTSSEWKARIEVWKQELSLEEPPTQ